MDNVDRKILAALEANCRITNVALADLVGLSPSPCLRRLRQLEVKRIIIGYTAIIAPKAMGLALAAFMHVTLEKGFRDIDETFQNTILQRPEVAGCYACAGDYDYLLKVVVPDHTTYAKFLVDLRRISGVANVKSGLVIDATPSIFAFYRVSYATFPSPRLVSQVVLPDAWIARVQEIDAFDQRIIVELQANARTTILKLAKCARLSPAATLKRLRMLESRNVICGYTAVVEPSAIGLGIVALVTVTLEKGFNFSTTFETAMVSRSEVAACFAVAGDVDYEIRVVVPDIQTYAKFLKDYLRRLPGVASVHASLFISPPPHLFARYQLIERAHSTATPRLQLAARR